jgi:hypothetical protein
MRKHISKPLHYPLEQASCSNNPPLNIPGVHSIPGVHLPNIEVHDDLVDEKFHQTVYEYLLDQPWYIAWSEIPGKLQLYKPNSWDDSWVTDGKMLSPQMEISRCMFGSDEASIKNKHPLIWELWQKINQQLGNKYTISGTPEGMYWKDPKIPPPEDPNLKPGWRVYANASPHTLLSSGWRPHRDNTDLTDDSTATIIWMASPEWYPSWGGEIYFYPEDPEGLSGDYQQFNTSVFQKNKNFRVGWPDQGRMVCLKPNRLLVYDSRTLHGNRPPNMANNNQLQRRIVFRAKLIK